MLPPILRTYSSKLEQFTGIFHLQNIMLLLISFPSNLFLILFALPLNTVNVPDLKMMTYFSLLSLQLLKTKEDEGADARIRTMEITKIDNGGGAGEQRTLVQYHFQSWPDFGVPSTPNSFLEFLHLVNRDHPSLPGSPSVVHCSAGIGRSGTFCLVDSCIEVARSGGALNLTQKEVLHMLHRMRRQRDGQVTF